MSTHNQTIGNKAQPLKLLLLGATKTEGTQCLKLVVHCGLLITYENAKDQATLNQALTKQKWDLIIHCNPLENVNIRQIVAALNAHNADSPLLFLTDELSSETALQALLDGAHNVISLQHQKHLQLILKRTVATLVEQRLLHQLQTETVTETKPPAAKPITNKKDLLTGLYNKPYFLAESTHIFEQCSSDDSSGNGLLYIKLNKIDELIAKVGVASADLIIADVANCISEHIPGSALLARFDDTNFTALLQQTDIKQLTTLADAICNTVANHQINVAGAKMPHVSLNIGISISSENINNVSLLISTAQLACKEATIAGINQARIFNTDDSDQAKAGNDEQKPGQHIQLALKDNRFKLLYQPIVSLQSKTAENYEILLRMIDENGNEILPGEFMPTAVEAGLMPAIDRWVTRNALSELSERRLDGKDTSFFIKIDHTTLSDNDFHPWLSERLRAAKIPGDALVFEISERSDLKDPEQVNYFIEQLKILHCRAGLDHFGGNAGSIERLQRLPVDFIKIDRSLVQTINDDDKVKSKVKKLLATAHEKEIRGIAEFVQDAKTLSSLWSCKMDYIQGYFLQQPDGTMDYDFTDEN